jgi:hypothetical protein
LNGFPGDNDADVGDRDSEVGTAGSAGIVAVNTVANFKF